MADIYQWLATEGKRLSTANANKLNLMIALCRQLNVKMTQVRKPGALWKQAKGKCMTLMGHHSQVAESYLIPDQPDHTLYKYM